MNYVKGDLIAALPDYKDKLVFIPHVVNNSGQTFHKGFVEALNNRWPADLKIKSPQWRYLSRGKNWLLGETQFVDPEPGIVVANMCAQDNLNTDLTVRLQYGHLARCMMNVEDEMVYQDCLIDKDVVVLAPKFGSGIAGGNWDIVENMIENIWCDFEVNIFYLP